MAAPSNSPADRPTEWVTAIGGLVTGFIAWRTDHDTAALVAVVMAVVPTLITLAKEGFGSPAPAKP